MNTEKQSENTNTFSEQTKRLEQQINFIREMDKEKFIGRQTYLSDGKRKDLPVNLVQDFKDAGYKIIWH